MAHNLSRISKILHCDLRHMAWILIAWVEMVARVIDSEFDFLSSVFESLPNQAHCHQPGRLSAFRA